MHRRSAYKSRFRRLRLRRHRWRSFFPASRGSRRHLRRRIGKQILEHIKSRAVQGLIELGRRRFHLRRRRQIRSLLAQLAKGRRRLDHHHPAALGARQNLPNCRLIAHPQPRPARRTRNCKCFHAVISRPRSIRPCPSTTSESFVAAPQVKAVSLGIQQTMHKSFAMHRNNLPHLSCIRFCSHNVFANQVIQKVGRLAFVHARQPINRPK